jgi:ribosomal protein S11
MTLITNTNKLIFLQIYKKFVFFYKKLQGFKHIKCILIVLLFLSYTISFNSKISDFSFLINYFKFLFKSNLKTKLINFVFKFKIDKLFKLSDVLYSLKKIKNFFNFLFSIYLHFFFVLRIFFVLKNKLNLLFFYKKIKISSFFYKKVYSQFLIYTTFVILLKKFFSLLKLRVITYKKRLLNVLNCYIKFTRHNIFITIASSFNVPIIIHSSGKSGYGGKTKFKISPQAAARSASLVVKALLKKKLIKKLVIFIVSNRLFDKRIKSILSVFSNKGLKISFIIPQLQRNIGGVRQKKIRRI